MMKSGWERLEILGIKGTVVVSSTKGFYKPVSSLSSRKILPNEKFSASKVYFYTQLNTRGSER
jgi:hypothetical protein